MAESSDSINAFVVGKILLAQKNLLLLLFLLLLDTLLVLKKLCVCHVSSNRTSEIWAGRKFDSFESYVHTYAALVHVRLLWLKTADPCRSVTKAQFVRRSHDNNNNNETLSHHLYPCWSLWFSVIFDFLSVAVSITEQHSSTFDIHLKKPIKHLSNIQV